MDEHTNKDDARSFTASLAGGDQDYVVPEEPKSKLSRTTVAFIGMAAIAAGGLFLMKQRAGPASAAAAVDADPAVTADRQSVRQFLAGGAAKVKEVEQLLADTEAIRERFGTLSRDRQVPLEELKTNPFWREQLEEAEVDQAALSEAHAQRLAAERERLRREAAEALAAEVAGVRVDTVMLGSRPVCQIEGRFLSVGDVLGDMTITAITRDGVTLRRGEHEAVARLSQ